MKNLFTKLITTGLIMASTTLAFSQANDWILSPSVRLTFQYGTGTAIALPGTSGIAGCGAGSTYLFQQYASVISDAYGSSGAMAFINNCGIYDLSGNSIGSGSYQNIFAIPGKCRKFYTMAWENVSGPPHYNKLTIRRLDATNATAITEDSSFDIVNDGYSHTGEIVVGPLGSDAKRKVYYADGATLKTFTVASDGTISSIVTVGTLPNTLDTRLNMELSPDGNKLVIVDIYNKVYYCDLTAATIAFTELGSFPSGKVISGIEYVPYSGGDRVYISFHTYSSSGTVTGTLGYVDIVNDPTTFVSIFDAVNASPYTTLPGTTSAYSFGFSEIELGKDGLLYFANNPNSAPNGSGIYTVSSGGPLYSLDPSSGTMTLIKISGTTQVYVNNYDDTRGYIVQKQIDGEDYNKSNYAIDIPTFLVGGISQPGVGTAGSILICNKGADSTLPLISHIDGYHHGYEVDIYEGTTTLISGYLYFTPYGTQPTPTTVIVNSPLADNNINLLTYFPWLRTYTGKISVTVKGLGCGTSGYLNQIFDLGGYSASALNFSMTGPGTQPAQAKHPTTTFVTFTQPVTSPPNKFGWLGANSAGISGYSVTVPAGAANTYHIVVDEVSPSVVSNIVDYSDYGGLSTSSVYNFNYLATQTDYLGHTGAGVGYFQDNYATIKNNAIFKVRVTINTNACGDVMDSSFFKIIDGGAGGKYYREAHSETIPKSELIVYPNPVKESVMFAWGDGEDNGIVNLVITDLLGRTVISKVSSETKGYNTLEVNMGNLTPGMYQYRISTKSVTRTGKLNKQ